MLFGYIVFDKTIPFISEPIALRTSHIWMAISLVGAIIKTCDKDISTSSISRAITPNTAVFPVPDFARIIRSIINQYFKYRYE